MRITACLRGSLLALLPLFGGCVYTCHRTVPSVDVTLAQVGRPMAWQDDEHAFVFRQRAVTTYQRAGVYPVGFRFFSGWMTPLEPVAHLPTFLLELPFAWESTRQFDVSVVARLPRAEAVALRPMPYYDLPAAERHGGRIARAFADPRFVAYRRTFEKEVDFEKGDAALAAGTGTYAPEQRYLRTYERWLADHVPLLAWEDYDGGENLLLRREKGLDHYRDLKLVRSYDVTLPYDALLDTLDGENVFIFFRGWAENRYFDAIPTSRKGSGIVSVLNLATGDRKDYGRFGDIPEAAELAKGLEIRVTEVREK